MRNHRIGSILALLLLVGTTGCGRDQDPVVSVPADDRDPTSTSTSATNSTIAAPAFAGSTAPVSGPAPASGKAYLTAVRAARQTGFERVVFEFRDGVPGYRVEYSKRPITQDGSGDDVTVAGGAVLTVRMEPASSFDTDAPGDGAPTYTGPKRFRPATTTVTELVQTGDFEAVLTWVVGVERELPFKVTVSTNPKPVLIVDIATS